MAETLPDLTPQQWRRLRSWQRELDAATQWRGDLPVVLLERCWLRLRAVPIEALARELPPDASAEAPELVHYRSLLCGGLEPWQAQLLCWQEYGAASCQDALRRYWERQDAGNGHWTLARYLALVERYRAELQRTAPRALPLLVTARHGSGEAHQIHWLQPRRQSMRHTCA
ncbi:MULTISPECIES: hypothetical protein [Aphanothece]|uniref:hypothetical protein n=1 Tax=Aphanothece TaxID=1121 RepID=UPI0039850A02